MIIGMPSRQLDFPVFDADNHMYETTEALTKHLPNSHRGLSGAWTMAPGQC